MSLGARRSAVHQIATRVLPCASNRNGRIETPMCLEPPVQRHPALRKRLSKSSLFSVPVCLNSVPRDTNRFNPRTFGNTSSSLSAPYCLSLKPELRRCVPDSGTGFRTIDPVVQTARRNGIGFGSPQGESTRTGTEELNCRSPIAGHWPLPDTTYRRRLRSSEATLLTMTSSNSGATSVTAMKAA